MVVMHNVLFEMEISDEKERQFVADVALLPQKMPEYVLAATGGRTFTDRGEGYTHGVMITLKDKESVPKYLDHPAHQQLGSRYGEFVRRKLAMDWEDSHGTISTHVSANTYVFIVVGVLLALFGIRAFFSSWSMFRKNKSK
eukprot:GEMP01080731.1.p2 GENE.GEMP01080731.1~~GEMP01080731.1.p2  ORF type:complete len:151 (+),score=28.52 GEMP01080731.1:33-455(+)